MPPLTTPGQTLDPVPVRNVCADPGLLDPTLAMLVRASADDDLCEATYLPSNLTHETALAYLNAQPDSSWVLFLDAVPCGLYLLEPVASVIGIDLPPHTFEREVWLLPEFRGRSIINSATSLLTKDLACHGVQNILSVAWESNQSAISSLDRSPLTPLGRVWWSREGFTPGWCLAYLLDTQDHHASTESGRHSH
jgi:hypothetical protein